MNIKDNLMGIEELASYLGVKVSTLYKWVHAKQVPYYKIGRLVKFRKSEVDCWIEDKRVGEVNIDTLI